MDQMLVLPSCCRTVGLCTFEAICHKITECARVFTLSIRFKIMAFRDRLSLISEDYFVFSIDSDQTNDLDDALCVCVNVKGFTMLVSILPTWPTSSNQTQKMITVPENRKLTDCI